MSSRRAIDDLMDEQAMRLVLPGQAQDPAAWLRFLGSVSEKASQQGLAAVAETARRFMDEQPDSPVRFEEQLAKLQAALSGESAPGAAAADAETNSIAQDPELIRDFILESREHLQSIERLMMELENDPSNSEPLHGTFRAFHTIKGLAGFLELNRIQSFAHEVETLLDEARNGKIVITPALVDVVLNSGDHVLKHIAVVEQKLSGQGAGSVPDSTELLAAIRAILNGEAAAASVEPSAVASSEQSAVPPPASTPVAEPVATAPPISQTPAATTPAQPAKASGETAPLKAASTQSANVAKKDAGVGSVKVDTAKLDYLVDMVGELVIAQSLIRHNPHLKQFTNTPLMRSITQLARITDEVQKTAMSMRMVPLETLFQKMARLVRDLSRRASKHIEMSTEGEDTELDRNIVEALADPLMHMVRNACDHGVETPAERVAAGKPPAANVKLSAAHHAGYIVITIADDGRGIRREKILAKARERGLIEGGDHLSDSEVFNLIFEPGFSTAEQVTDISGRGVGMDVVKRQIQKLRGRIDIKSVPGQGTEFALKVPLTLAIIDGLIVGVGSERYILPIFAVKEMLRPQPGMVSTMENRVEVALVRGRVLPVVRLHARFDVEPKSRVVEESLMIIAEARGQDFCLIVDELIGKQEVVIKSLSDGIQAVPGIAGGAILGDGRVGLILDVNGVFSPEQSEAEPRGK